MCIRDSRYAGLAIPPLIILAIPCLLVLGQLYPTYGLKVDEKKEIVITAKLRDNVKEDSLTLQIDGNTSNESNSTSIFIPEIGEKSWKIPLLDGVPESVTIFSGAKTSGEVGSSADSLLKIPLIKQADDKKSSHLLASGADSAYLAWLTGSVAVPASLSKVVKHVSVNYQDREISWLGISWNWIILFFIISLIAGLIISRYAKIEI